MSKIYNRRCLITGCAGSIGSELCRQLSEGNKIFGIDQNESEFFNIQQETGIFGRVGDIRSKETVFDIFSDFKPQIVFHVAAYKHVPLMEKYPEEAIRTNILGTLNVINEAKKWECLEKFVFISSDKAVNSNSIMGATKRMGEIMVKNQGKGFCVVRFGNVIGSRGSLYTIWDKQIKNKQPITVTDKRMVRYFMGIDEACELVIMAAQKSKGGEIFILDMGELKSVYVAAQKLSKKYGLPIKIIGIREGEVLEEQLMFKEEKERCIRRNKFFIIK